MKTKKGIFVTFEGIEGCGKSTQAELLASYLKKRGRRVFLTREPGGPKISEDIREILLKKENSEMLPETELLLYMASRSQHTGEWINSLAAEPPKYNDNFTEMTVKLRKGIYWSDGVEFTADDLVFTVEYLKAHEGMLWNADFSTYVDKVEKLDDYTVKFNLKERDSTFLHNLTLGLLPKHIWENISPANQHFHLLNCHLRR